ncbi:MAG TPA: Rieske 2Fe-2S domain-containing protein, partial [Nitrososphaerales archaeon]|nr:Rieske 2Fe-2S domain-containing protein [Nitrososphaerales archaeon]
RASPQAPSQAASVKETAVRGFRRIQLATGAMLLLSSAAGVYLLATDASLWLLAVSHAVGLIIIVVVDFVLGLYSLASSKSVYLLSIAAGVLGFALQAGDVFTAPQYNMTIPYFAHYLFGLGAFDVLLALQAGVICAGVLGRPHARYLSRRKSKSQRLDYTRRGFIRAAAGLAGLVGVGVVVGSIKLPTPTSGTKTTTTGSVQGSVANVNDLHVGVPVYFEYPAGYPNALIKNSDGSLTALSILCTHVCCECSFDSSSSSFFCPCHGSLFDSSGRVVRGPASTDLPAISLRVDGSGNVYPTGVSNPGPCQV